MILFLEAVRRPHAKISAVGIFLGRVQRRLRAQRRRRVPLSEAQISIPLASCVTRQVAPRRWRQAGHKVLHVEIDQCPSNTKHRSSAKSESSTRNWTGNCCKPFRPAILRKSPDRPNEVHGNRLSATRDDDGKSLLEGACCTAIRGHTNVDGSPACCVGGYPVLDGASVSLQASGEVFPVMP